MQLKKRKIRLFNGLFSCTSKFSQMWNSLLYSTGFAIFLFFFSTTSLRCGYNEIITSFIVSISSTLHLSIIFNTISLSYLLEFLMLFKFEAEYIHYSYYSNFLTPICFLYIFTRFSKFFQSMYSCICLLFPFHSPTSNNFISIMVVV